MMADNKNKIVLDSLLPWFLNPESSDYEESKVIKAGIFYIYNERAYIKSCLVIEEKGSERFIVMLLWVSMGSKLFIKFAENPDEYDGLFSTQLHLEIPFYECSNNIEVNIDFKIAEDGIPYMFIPESCSVDSLFYDFKHGISKEKFDMIHDKLYSKK